MNALCTAAIYPVMAGHYIVSYISLGPASHHQIYAGIVVAMVTAARMLKSHCASCSLAHTCADLRSCRG